MINSKLFMLDRNKWNHLTVLKKLSSGSYKNVIKKMCLEIIYQFYMGCSRGVMVKAIDCGIIVSEFELQSRYYVHFRTNSFGKGKNANILRAMG